MRTESHLRSLAIATFAAGLFSLAVALGTSAPLRHKTEEVILPGKHDWPMFGGDRSRNFFNSFSRSLPTDWSVDEGKMKNIKWHAKIGSYAYGSIAVGDDKVFVGTNNQCPRDPADVDAQGEPIDLGVLMCFRASDGEFLWQAKHAKLPTGRINDWPRIGIVSTPAVEGNRLYYVSNRCELICASTANGKAIWSLDMIKDLGVFPHNMSSCSPLIAGNLIYVVTSNGVDADHLEIPAPLAPSFIAVDKRLGKVVWKDNTPTAKAAQINVPMAQRRAVIEALRNGGELAAHGQWSNPAFTVVDGVEQVLFPGGDGWLRSFNTQGQLLWAFNGNPKNTAFQWGGKGERSEIVGTPVVANGRVYFAMGQDPEHNVGVGHLWCVDLKKAMANARVNAGRDVSPQQNNFDPNAAVNAGSALAWHYGGAVPKNLIQMEDRRYYFGRTLSTCAVADGLVYAADLNGVLQCFDAASGQRHWKHDTMAESWSSPFIADGKVYFGNDDGKMTIFAHGKKLDVLAEIEMDRKIRASPVAVGNVLYVAADDHLYAIAKE